MSDLAILGSDRAADLLRELGFTAEDITEATAAGRRALDDPMLTAAVGGFIEFITSQLGAFLSRPAADPPPESAKLPETTLGPGVVQLLAFIATADKVKAFHSSRGVPLDVSRATLADLGRQVATHRRVCGEFGLETHSWMTLHWTGALYQLGRLQFDLGRIDPASSWSRVLPGGVAVGDWAPGVHIPEAGPLDPESTTSSLQRLRPFLAAHFPEVVAASMVRCVSWMLDPYLGQALPDSNVARFQALFALDGLAEPNTQDIVYFVFRKRGVDIDRLPRDTRLQRVVLDRIAAGGQWQNYRGWRAF